MLGIAMSVIIVGSVVSGAVGTSLRRIGILKAVGFTPREVVRAYVAQAVIPAGAGIALGVVLGNLLAVPLLDDTEEAYLDVYETSHLVLLGLAGVVIALLGALLPAGWAAKARTATALRTE